MHLKTLILLNFLLSVKLILLQNSPSSAATLRPFVRSKYSLRWKKITETPIKVIENSTLSNATINEILTTPTTILIRDFYDSTLKENTKALPKGTSTTPQNHYFTFHSEQQQQHHQQQQHPVTPMENSSLNFIEYDYYENPDENSHK